MASRRGGKAAGSLPAVVLVDPVAAPRHGGGRSGMLHGLLGCWWSHRSWKHGTRSGGAAHAALRFVFFHLDPFWAVVCGPWAEVVWGDTEALFS